MPVVKIQRWIGRSRGASLTWNRKSKMRRKRSMSRRRRRQI
jgi:hypothetical protein